MVLQQNRCEISRAQLCAIEVVSGEVGEGGQSASIPTPVAPLNHWKLWRQRKAGLWSHAKVRRHILRHWQLGVRVEIQRSH